MRRILSFLFILIPLSGIFGQVKKEGKVSYISSDHVYVRFDSMEGIEEGDSLYINRGEEDIPALQIKSLSSISCLCVPLLSDVFQVADVVYAHVPGSKLPESDQEAVNMEPEPSAKTVVNDSLQATDKNKKKLTQAISGRLSLSSYSLFSNSEAPGNQRMRYTFSIRADNLGNSKFSAESYLSFVHSGSNWEEVKENIFTGLKIYNLSLKYAFDESMYLSLGRKINPKLSSVGAIDGLQFEKRFGSLSLGTFVGSRPDYADFSVNPDLLQYGLYMSHELPNKNGNMQNTLALIEQTNQSRTDRRFVYFQHTNTLVNKLFFFASAEVDLYRKVDDIKENTFTLTNTYLSLRYRIIRPLSAGISYTARNNLIYYETYKDFVERLLDTEALQGWRFRINYQPSKHIFLGLNAGYRFRKEDPRPTKNLHGFLTYSQVPGIGAAVTLSSTWLETSYLTGIIYGLAISKELLSGKLSGGLKYRYVDYLYQNSEMPLVQNVGEVNLSWRVYKKLSLSVYYEGTFENDLPYQRLYVNMTQRF